jgi:hypothetical protein
MSENDVKKWLAGVGFLRDCRTCEDRKEGCSKDCEFIKAYKARCKKGGADNEQREITDK